MVIYKYPFKIDDEFTLAMPAGARVLSAQMQGGTPCLWALVDPAQEMMWKHFHVFGTGQHVANESIRVLEFVATVQDGPLVWHVFGGVTRFGDTNRKAVRDGR